MRNVWFYAFLIVSLCQVSSPASALLESNGKLDESDEETHLRLVRHLSTDQMKTLSVLYPDFRLLKVCRGQFSDADREELVLGVWKPVESKDWWKKQVHRVGLIWSGNSWSVHVIDDEIEEDKDLSRSVPMKWEYEFDESGFSGEMKCGIESEFDEDSDLTYILGDRPFFNLETEGLSKHKPFCFATSNVSNNWDCVVCDPSQNRFRLWFQQAHAD